MFSFLSRRFISSAFMIFIASIVVFLVIHVLPGDPVLMLLGEQAAADPVVVKKMRTKLGLDLPLHIQYYKWIKGVTRLNFGNSLQMGIPVKEELLRRIPRSLELIFLALLIATISGIPLGVLGGMKPDSPSGWVVSIMASTSFSSPIFVTGLFFVIIFSIIFNLMPSCGYVSLSQGISAHFSYLLLPAFTLGINFMGVVIRITRGSFLDVLTRDFVRTAHAKGLSNTTVNYRHVLLNSLIPVVTILGVRAGNLLGGTVVIEYLFAWPGLSSLLVMSCYSRDYPLIQGCLFSIFVMFALISLFIDLCHGLLDPKIRQG